MPDRSRISRLWELTDLSGVALITYVAAFVAGALAVFVILLARHEWGFAASWALMLVMAVAVMRFRGPIRRRLGRRD